MKKVLLVALSIFLTCPPADARIGESIKECDARYGKPTAVDDDAARGTTKRTYKTPRAYMSFNFYKGVCVRSYYHFNEPKQKGKWLPDSVVGYLLAVNADEGDRWGQVTGKFEFTKYFESSLTHATAWNTDEILSIESRKFLELDKKASPLKGYVKPASHPLVKGL